MAHQITYEHVDPAKLKKHPLSIAIYGDTPDPAFVESCKGGIIQPVIITSDYVIVSGHSRVQAARIHKFKTIAAIIRRDLKDPLEIETLVILSNEGREKTVEQKAREYEQLKRIEAAKAAQRQAAAGGDKTKTPPKTAEKPPKSASDEIILSAPGKAADIAAEAVGMSTQTAERAVEVVHKIDELEAAGETEKAEELRETLEKNVAKAHREATAEPEPEKPRRQPKNGAPVSFADDPKIDKGIDALMRLFDSRAAKLGKGPHHKSCLDAIRQVKSEFSEWKKANAR